jgi:hypothetical protein
LWPLGGTASRSYVDVSADGVRIKYGFFDVRIGFDEVESVERGRWPWWGGLGWRSNLVGRIGLVASYSGIVDIELRTRRWVWLVMVPLPCKRVTLSLEDAEGFLAAVSPLLKQPA